MYRDGRTGPDQRLDQLVAAIRTYLDQRPNSMDTLAGIASFWLPGRQEVDRDQLLEAIRALTAVGELEEVRSGGITKYRRPR